MAKRRRFAEGTPVPVVRTRSELDNLLEKHGAGQVIFGRDTVGGRIVVGFTMAKRQVRIEWPMPTDDPPEERRRWRALLLIVKAKLELVNDGLSTVQAEFLADIVLPNGQRVGQALEGPIRGAYLTGQMAPLLPEYTGE